MPRKSWIADTAETVAAIPAKIAKAITLAAAPKPRGDPWYRDDERKRAINEPASRRWIPHRPDWLRRRGP